MPPLQNLNLAGHLEISWIYILNLLVIFSNEILGE
jgi:hypothetical protein